MPYSSWEFNDRLQMACRPVDSCSSTDFFGYDRLFGGSHEERSRWLDSIRRAVTLTASVNKCRWHPPHPKYVLVRRRSGGRAAPRLPPPVCPLRSPPVVCLSWQPCRPPIPDAGTWALPRQTAALISLIINQYAAGGPLWRGLYPALASVQQETRRGMEGWREEKTRTSATPATGEGTVLREGEQMGGGVLSSRGRRQRFGEVHIFYLRQGLETEPDCEDRTQKSCGSGWRNCDVVVSGKCETALIKCYGRVRKNVIHMSDWNI